VEWPQAFEVSVILDPDQRIERMRATDALMYKTDREGWQAVQLVTNARSVGVLIIDDDPNHTQADDYRAALGDLSERKFDREQAAEIAALEAAEAKLLPNAACEQKPAKKTHKPREENRSLEQPAR
jgi:hypothetical protein